MLKRGFSLIEVLTALALMSVVLVFLFSSFSYQNATHTVTDQISEVSQNSSAVARLIERDIRSAGYLVPPAAAACGVDGTTAPDMLFVSDTDAIVTVDQLPVELAGDELGGETSDDIGSSTPPQAVDVDVDDLVVDPNPATNNASYDTNGDGTNDSDFRIGGGAILIDRGNPTRGVSCGIVTAVNTTTKSVSVNFLAIYNTATPAQGKDLVLVPAHVYRVTAGPPMRLERDGDVLAKDVEDLQVSWWYDDDTDDVLDETGETRADGDTGYQNDAIDGEELREIRVNLVLATRTNDMRNPDDAGIGQPRENRTAASTPAADGKHRRVHTATVRLRNLTL